MTENITIEAPQQMMFSGDVFLGAMEKGVFDVEGNVREEKNESVKTEN